MPTIKRPPLSQECIEARIVLRVAQLGELAAWIAANTGASARAPTASVCAASSGCRSEWQLDAAVHNLRKLHRESVHRARNQGNGGAKARKMA